jgi:hypothetical protein
VSLHFPYAIDWARTGTTLVWVILIAVAIWLYLELASWVGGKLHEADLRQQEEVRESCRKLALLSAIADEIETLPDSPERRRLYREAEALGFLDSDDLPRSA